ncbi:MAG: SdrD B-like domain-containing protein [Armatimonadota bacterium]|nr:SdrD B-like domain-containing protein [Armatimonadota bacterium]
MVWRRLRRRVVCVLAIILALGTLVPAVVAQGASISLVLEDTSYSSTNQRTIYHYALYVSDNSILTVGESFLHVRGMDGVLAQGDAIAWRNAGITQTSATWQFADEVPSYLTRFAYFDLVADATLTRPGLVDYEVEAEEGRVGQVEGPVAKIPQEVYEISGTVFYDSDVNGLFGPPDDTTISGGTVELLNADGQVVATERTNSSISDGDGGYIGNYLFSDVPPGEYTVRAPLKLSGPDGELLITTGSLQSVAVTTAPVREADFGYADLPQPIQAQVTACVFFDADTDGVFDDNETGLTEVAVTLSGGAAATLDTGSGGLADFGLQGEGSYAIEVTGDGGYGLSDYWTATTPTSQSFDIDAETERPVLISFGFYPDADAIVRGIRDCEITGDNRNVGFWRHNIRKALEGQTHGAQIPAGELLGYLSQVEAMGPYDDPFDLGESKLEAAYDCLHPGASGNSPMAKLYRQLLAAELNWVSGRSSSMLKLEAMVLWYAEYVANEDEAMAEAWADVLEAWNSLGDTNCGDVGNGGNDSNDPEYEADGRGDNGNDHRGAGGHDRHAPGGCVGDEDTR